MMLSKRITENNRADTAAAAMSTRIITRRKVLVATAPSPLKSGSSADDSEDAIAQGKESEKEGEKDFSRVNAGALESINQLDLVLHRKLSRRPWLIFRKGKSELRAAGSGSMKMRTK